MDPLADKLVLSFVEGYPGWSPYNYTLNNPLAYIDINGQYVITSLDGRSIFRRLGIEEAFVLHWGGMIPGLHLSISIFNWVYNDDILGKKGTIERIWDLMGGKTMKFIENSLKTFGWIFNYGYKGSEALFIFSDWNKIHELVDKEEKAFKKLKKNKFKGVFIFDQEDNNSRRLILTKEYVGLFKSEDEAVQDAQQKIDKEIEGEIKPPNDYINEQLDRYSARR